MRGGHLTLAKEMLLLLLLLLMLMLMLVLMLLLTLLLYHPKRSKRIIGVCWCSHPSKEVLPLCYNSKRKKEKKPISHHRHRSSTNNHRQKAKSKIKKLYGRMHIKGKKKGEKYLRQSNKLPGIPSSILVSTACICSTIVG